MIYLEMSFSVLVAHACMRVVSAVVLKLVSMVNLRWAWTSLKALSIVSVLRPSGWAFIAWYKPFVKAAALSMVAFAPSPRLIVNYICVTVTVSV